MLCCLVLSCLVWSGLVWSSLVWSGLVLSGLVLSCLVWSCLVWPGQTMSCRTSCATVASIVSFLAFSASRAKASRLSLNVFLLFFAARSTTCCLFLSFSFIASCAAISLCRQVRSETFAFHHKGKHTITNLNDLLFHACNVFVSCA